MLRKTVSLFLALLLLPLSVLPAAAEDFVNVGSADAFFRALWGPAVLGEADSTGDRTFALSAPVYIRLTADLSLNYSSNTPANGSPYTSSGKRQTCTVLPGSVIDLNGHRLTLNNVRFAFEAAGEAQLAPLFFGGTVRAVMGNSANTVWALSFADSVLNGCLTEVYTASADAFKSESVCDYCVPSGVTLFLEHLNGNTFSYAKNVCPKILTLMPGAFLRGKGDFRNISDDTQVIFKADCADDLSPARIAQADRILLTADVNAPGLSVAVPDGAVLDYCGHTLTCAGVTGKTTDSGAAELPRFGTRYTLQEGESLYSVARRFWGSGAKWPMLYAVNRDVLGADPSAVRPGTVLNVLCPMPEGCILPTGEDGITLFEVGENLLLAAENIRLFYNSADSFLPAVDYSRSTVGQYAACKLPEVASPLLRWEVTDPALSGWQAEVHISRDPDFPAEETQILPAEAGKTEVSFANPFVGTRYYWFVLLRSPEGKTVSSDVGTFSTGGDQPRLVALPDATLKNLRDAGGRRLPDGTLTNQGLAYRSAQMDDPTVGYLLSETDQDYLLHTLGIRTDVDFRSEDEKYNPERSALGKKVTYLCPRGTYYLAALTEPTKIERLRMMLIPFSDLKNYPILFHCAGGVDRTGTTATMLQLLCGVSEADAVRDYELSTFQAGARYRNNTGITGAGPLDYGKMMQFLHDAPGKTMQEKTQNVLHDTVGLPWQRLDNILGIFVGNSAIFADSLAVPSVRQGAALTVKVRLRGSGALERVTAGGALAFETAEKDGVTSVTLHTESLAPGSYTAVFTFDDVTRRLEFRVTEK